MGKLAPKAEACDAACGDPRPGPQKTVLKAPHSFWDTRTPVWCQVVACHTATPWLTAISGCHSGKTAADDTDILFFLLSYHTGPCTPFTACLLGGLAPSVISFPQNLPSLLPPGTFPVSVSACRDA